MLLGVSIALPLSATHTFADQLAIQLEISHQFDWSAASIRKLAHNTAKVYSKRCENPCVIKVRVMINGNAQRVSEKRLRWLSKNLKEEMAKKTTAEITVLDKLLFV